jgi:hypothetical protein
LETRLNFARELPRFVAEVRRIFTPAEMRQLLARTARKHRAASPRERIRSLQELLTAPQLGTS